MFLVSVLALAFGLLGDCGHTPVLAFGNGLIDAREEALYVELIGGGIAAVELHSGREIWRTGKTGRPLGIKDDDLIVSTAGAMRNELQIVLLKKATGETSQVIPLLFPEDVATSSTRFDYQVSESEGKVHLSWTYAPSTRGGTARQPDAGIPLAPRLSGAKDVDLRTAKDVQSRVANVPSHDEKDRMFFPRRDDENSTYEPWAVGDTVVQLSIRKTDSEKQIFLTENSGGKVERHTLIGGRYPSAYRSSDGCYVFVLRDPLLRQYH